MMTRVIAIVTSPRSTFAEVIVRPRALGVTLLVVGVAAACSVAFLMTDVGSLASLDRQIRQLESVGFQVTDEMYARLQSAQPNATRLSVTGILVGWPLLWVLLAVVLQGLLNRGAGARPSVRQVYAVVAHAGVILALRAVVSLPVNYARESMGGATSLGALFPIFGEATFPARLSGAIDFFVLWWISVLAVGLSVLYDRRAGPIARRLFLVYGAGALALAAAQALSGG